MIQRIIRECKYQKWVCCNEAGPKCKRCGWNPAVSRRRLDKVLDKIIELRRAESAEKESGREKWRY